MFWGKWIELDTEMTGCLQPEQHFKVNLMGIEHHVKKVGMAARPSDEDIRGNTEKLNLFSDSPGISPAD